MTNTNAISVVLISAVWLTNYIETPPAPRGNCWYRTNIVSVETRTAVVGAGMIAHYQTNRMVVGTNTTRLRIIEEPLPR